jgi:alpha-beta hydrolase superfamily lysophospholipase
MAAARTPVVFVHGLWLHAESWQPWIELFRERGYDASAIGWPGDAATVADTRAGASAVAGHGIQDVVEHYTAAIGELPAKPIVIGHSFGGLIAQRLLGENNAAAAVAIDPAPMKGVLFLPLSALRVASVALRNPANRNGAVSLNAGQFRYGFANAVSQSESDELFERWTIPSPGKPLFEAASANLMPHSPASVATGNPSRGPLLLTAGGEDRTVPATVVRQASKLYRHSSALTELKEFPDRGHSLTIDSGWREIADAVLDWLTAHDL